MPNQPPEESKEPNGRRISLEEVRRNKGITVENQLEERRQPFEENKRGRDSIAELLDLSRTESEWFEIVKNLKDQSRVFEFADKIKDLPEAGEFLELRAESYPVQALCFAYKYKKQSYAERVIAIAAAKDSYSFCIYLEDLLDQPYLEKILIQRFSADRNFVFLFMDFKDRWQKSSNVEKILRITLENLINSADFFYFVQIIKDYDWVGEMIVRAAGVNPAGALQSFNIYVDKDYAQKVIEQVAESNPATVLAFCDKFLRKSYSERVITRAAERDLNMALLYAVQYEDEPFGPKLIEKTVRTMLEKQPFDILNHLRVFGDKPYAAEVVAKTILLSPRAAMFRIEKCKKILFSKKQKYRLEWEILQILERVRPFNSAVLLVDKIVNKEITLEKAGEIARIPNLMEDEMMKLFFKPGVIGSVDIESFLQNNSLNVVNELNRLHDLPSNERFKSVANANLQRLYVLMVMGEEELFTSSFNGVFNLLLEKMQQQKKSGDVLLHDMGNKKFRVFLKLCSRYNRLGDFLKTMSGDNARELIKSFVVGIEKEPDFLEEATNVADFFMSLGEKDLIVNVQKLIKTEYVRVQNGKNENGIKIYGLLAGMFGEKAVFDGEWYRKMAEQYRLDNLAGIESKELFSRNTSVQRYFFYNDDDGRASFNHFMAFYKGDAKWQIMDEKTYIMLEAEQGGRKIRIFANKPDEVEAGNHEVDEKLKKEMITPSIIVHRGHSFHASETIEKIQSSAKVVVLGSCGGYANVERVLNKAKKAHILATKGTGTMTVNDVILKQLNNQLLSGEDLDWRKFWQEIEKKVAHNPAFADYIPPHRNFSVMFIKAYNGLSTTIPKF